MATARDGLAVLDGDVDVAWWDGGWRRVMAVLEWQLALLPQLRCAKGLKAELPTADPHTSAAPTGP